MEKLLKILLEEQEVKVTDALKDKLQKVWNEEVEELKKQTEGNTEGLFTQEELNEHIQKRLARQEKSHEAEIKALQERMENLVEADKVKEVESEFKNQLESLKSKRDKEVAEYELRLAATKAGANDEDYVLFLANKKGLDKSLKVNEQGEVFCVDSEGKELKDEEGNMKGVEHVIEQLKEEAPTHFSSAGKDEPKKRTPGPTMPTGGVNTEILKEEKRKRAREEAERLGYKKKDKESGE